MISATVKGDKNIADEMLKMADQMGYVVNQTVPVAARVCARAGQEICKPGEVYRNIIKRKSAKPRNKNISDRTDTSRYSTHWVVFLRQGKKPFYVPVNPNPGGGDYDDPDNTRSVRDHARNDSSRKRTRKPSARSMYRYQQTRKSTARNKRGNIKRYDSPSEIQKMRKIGRRGLASESWAFMGNEVPRSKGKKLSIRSHEQGLKGGRITNRDRKKYAEKYTRVRGRLARDSASIHMENNLSYIKKQYAGIEPRLIRLTAEKLEGETKRLVIQRAKAAEKRMKRRAA